MYILCKTMHGMHTNIISSVSAENLIFRQVIWVEIVRQPIFTHFELSTYPVLCGSKAGEFFVNTPLEPFVQIKSRPQIVKLWFIVSIQTGGNVFPMITRDRSLCLPYPLTPTCHAYRRMLAPSTSQMPIHNSVNRFTSAHKIV